VAGSEAGDAKSPSGRCVTETGSTTRTRREKAVGLLSDSGAASCRALSGGSPDGRAAAARSVAPLPQVGGTRRNAASMTAPARSDRGPSPVPGILLPRKITVIRPECRALSGAAPPASRAPEDPF
jgi:hypothetical protein